MDGSNINVYDEYLIRRGYKEFAPTSFDSVHVSKCFQKRFDDEIGKKYFITVYKYNPIYPMDKVVYEYDIQLKNINNENPINLKYFSGWEIEEVESYMEKLWDTKLFGYYERWDEC